MFKSLFASFISLIGLNAANVGSQACAFFVLDEPQMPKSLIK